MDPTLRPIARALFSSWQRARGGRTESASRPFTRAWEDLLEEARLVTAMDRDEAERDLRELEADGWVGIVSVQYRAHLVARARIPLEAEARWCQAFGFRPPTDQEQRMIQEHAWSTRMAFVTKTRLNLAFDDLRRLDDFLRQDAGAEGRLLIPIKERSLQIFGDEKRLDALQTSVLFNVGQLDLRGDFRCEPIGVPLAWERGPAAAALKPLLIVENACTWHSYARWNRERGWFSGVVYGDGNRFVEGVRYLAGMFSELGGVRRCVYFGDLDPPGLNIPQVASQKAVSLGLPVVEPHLWSYRHLLRLGSGSPWEGPPPSPTLCDWLGDCAGPAREWLAAGKRLAQEHVGYEFLRSCPADASEARD